MSKIIGIIIVIMVAVGAGWFIYNDINKDNKKPIVVVDDIVATSTDNIIKNTDENIKNIETISDVVKKIDKTAPNLDKPIIFFNKDISEETKTLLHKKITDLRSSLKEDNDLFTAWLYLGVNYKIIGDYESARDAWEYASKIRPKNTSSFANLGDLYHYYLKNFQKAEQNLRTAIQNDKKNTGAYIALHELYKYSYKQDTNLAESVLLEGIASSISRATLDIDLVITLAAYYKERGDTEKGDITNAKKYYTQARDEAQNLGNTNLVNLLNQELAELSNLHN